MKVTGINDNIKTFGFEFNEEYEDWEKVILGTSGNKYVLCIDPNDNDVTIWGEIHFPEVTNSFELKDWLKRLERKSPEAATATKKLIRNMVKHEAILIIGDVNVIF